MTPQERQLVSDLFDRLAALESNPRDAEAERAIREGLARAPNAVYALVQSVLVQDEALKRADARIQELEGDADERPEADRGFLDTMRDTLFGGGSRPTGPRVRPADEPMGVPPQYRANAAGAGDVRTAPYEPPPSRGGSFLGTAAAAAAGVIGGALLLDGIRSVLGGSGQGGAFAGTFDKLAGTGTDGQSSGSDPWDVKDGGALGRQAGTDDVASVKDDGEGDRHAGLFGDADTDANAGADDYGSDDDDFDDGDDGGFDGDIDYA